MGEENGKARRRIANRSPRQPSPGIHGRSGVHMEFHGHYSKTVLNWLLGLSGTVVLAMLAGSYTFTYLQAEAQDIEKIRWREEHIKVLTEKLGSIKENQIESRNTANEMQKAIMEQNAILREMNARAQMREDLYFDRWEQPKDRRRSHRVPR